MLEKSVWDIVCGLVSTSFVNSLSHFNSGQSGISEVLMVALYFLLDTLATLFASRCVWELYVNFTKAATIFTFEH